MAAVSPSIGATTTVRGDLQEARATVAITAGQGVYVKDGRASLADEGDGDFTGICVTGSAAANLPIFYAPPGTVLSNVVTAQTVGDPIYLGANGALDDAIPTTSDDYITQVGIIVATTDILVTSIATGAQIP